MSPLPFFAAFAVSTTLLAAAAETAPPQPVLLETFTYRTPMTSSILTPEAKARLLPDNVIHIWCLAGGEFQALDEHSVASPTVGLEFYNEGGFGIGDIAVRADLSKRPWLDGSSSTTARFTTTFFKPFFEGPTWTAGAPRDDVMIFRVGAVVIGAYDVRLDDRDAGDANSHWSGQTGLRTATGPLTYADLTIGRQEDYEGLRAAGALHVPILLLHPKIRVFAYVEVGRGVGANGHGDDFVAGFEFLAATL
jgi:hypothetical protein